MALFDGASLDCERAAKEKFYKYCHERELNPNKFPGVTLRELVDVEDIFEINVVVYALELDDQSPKATVVQLSRKMYERTMNVNLHESNFSCIFDVSKYCQRYECPRCSEFWTSEHFHRHVRTCDAQVKHTYVGGVYNNKKTVFGQLEQPGINVPHEDRFYPYRSTFDYESYFDKSDLPDAGEKSVWVARHVPCSVSVCSNVPKFEQPKCFINASPQRLVHDKMQYLETIADAAFEIWKEKFQYVFDQVESENKQHQAVKGRFVSYLQEHIVIGFNSSSDDIPLVKAHLLEYLLDKIKFVILKGKSFTCLATTKLKFLDIKNYIAPGFDYAKFIRAYEVEQQKFHWPYEWFQNFQQLDEPTLPPHKEFYSSLKKENISQEAYALCQTIWNDKNWTSILKMLSITAIWTSSRFCKLWKNYSMRTRNLAWTPSKAV